MKFREGCLHSAVLSKIVNDQSTFNETVTHNLEIQWSAIHIIVNQIKERE